MVIEKRTYPRISRVFLNSVLGPSIGVALGIGVLTFLSQISGASYIIPSYGASCLIAFLTPKSGFAQPKNIIGGHFLSTVVGMLCFEGLPVNWWSFAIASGISVLLMQLSKTMHPPAAADPIMLIMQGGAAWQFWLSPVLAGSILLVFLAIIINNIIGQPYPRNWLG